MPSNSDTDLIDEVDNTKRWAAPNHMVINLQKNTQKNLSFDDPIPGLLFFQCPFDQIEQVHCAKLRGIYLSDTLQFETHLVNLLKICSQRTYLLKRLRDQGMPRTHLNTVFRP